MQQADVINILQEAITVVITVSAPMLLIGMVVGVIISIFQSTTQINEQTLAFVPKIIAIFLTILVLGSWIFTSINEFTEYIFEYIISIGR